MAEHTASQAVSGGVAGIGQLPTFVLPAVGRGQIRSWDYKGRNALVVWLAGSELSEAALAMVAAREPDVRREGAELIVILRGPGHQTEAIGARHQFRGALLADGDGRVHALFGADKPTLLVTDRHGTIYWRESVKGDVPDIDEALSWLAYINILEPECGTCVPAWPVD